LIILIFSGSFRVHEHPLQSAYLPVPVEFFIKGIGGNKADEPACQRGKVRKIEIDGKENTQRQKDEPNE